MGKVDTYREALRALDQWDAFLLRESGLPGPRGNLELARAVADEGDPALFERLSAFDAERAPVNSAQEFLAFCGVLGFGRLLVEGRMDVLERLRLHASDPRWRVREAVAMALQRWGEHDFEMLLATMERWAGGAWLEQRAAIAALCEPGLLKEPAQVRRVLAVLDRVTAALGNVDDHRSSSFRALRKGLGYCWSVAVVALPDEGKRYMERWQDSSDPDVRWVMRENLKKKRLERLDTAWTAAMWAHLKSGP